MKFANLAHLEWSSQTKMPPYRQWNIWWQLLSQLGLEISACGASSLMHSQVVCCEICPRLAFQQTSYMHQVPQEAKSSIGKHNWCENTFNWRKSKAGSASVCLQNGKALWKHAAFSFAFARAPRQLTRGSALGFLPWNAASAVHMPTHPKGFQFAAFLFYIAWNKQNQPVGQGVQCGKISCRDMH